MIQTETELLDKFKSEKPSVSSEIKFSDTKTPPQW